MNKFSDKEIESKVREIWGAHSYASGSGPENIEVRQGDGTVTIEISSMYDPPGLGFANMSALAEFFGTKNINDDSFSHGGCESCDYGSKYGFTLTVRPN